MRSKYFPAAVQAAAIVVAVAIVLRPFLQLRGLPAFNHDWSWPPSAVQAYTLLSDSMLPYSRNNFGGANYAIVAAPLWAANALCVYVFGVASGLKVLVFALLVAAGWAAAFFVRRLGGGRLAQSAGAILYAASPVVANELAAGHVAYLLGYAALPAVASCAFILSRRWSVPAVLALAALLPLTIAQPQFAFFYAFVCALAACCAGRLRFALILAAAAAAALLSSPYEAALALFGHSAQALSFDRTNLHWEATNSSPLAQSFVASGYAGGYDASAPGTLLLLRTICGAGLWIAAIVSLAFSRAGFPRALIAAGIVAAFVVAGTNGVFESALVWIFAHVPAAALFRELYHCAAFVVLALVAAIALTRGRRAAVVVAVLAIGFAAPQLTGSFWGFVHPYDPAEMQAVADRVAAGPGDGAVLYLPLLQPLGPAGGAAGADPDAFAIGSHPAIWEFIPRQPMSQIDALLRYRPDEAQKTLRAFGVQYVVLRAGWASQYFERAEPALRKIFAFHPPPEERPLRVARALHSELREPAHELASVAGAQPGVGSSLSDVLYRLPLAAAFSPDVRTPDPSKAWVNADRWQWWSAAFLGPINPGVFSLGGVEFELPDPRGAVVANIPERAKGYAILRLPGNARRVSFNGPAILSGYVASRTYRRNVRPCGNVAGGGDEYRIDGAGCKLLTIEALENRNGGWILRDAKGAAIAPLDTAWDEKWLAPANRGPYVLRRELDTPLAVALILQRFAWGAALAALALLGILQTRRLGW